MQTKDFGLNVKKVSELGEFEGYASVFGGPPDSVGDIVQPGAFANSLARHKREGSMPAMLWGHRAGEPPIGMWRDIAEDGRGLWVSGQLDLEDTTVSRVHRALKQGALRGLSIGYQVKQEERDEKRPGVNLLTELDLYEVSVVNFPANRRSVVTAVKAGVKDLRDRLAAGERLTEREWERLIKDQFELSNVEAERAVRINLKGQGEPDGTAKRAAFLRALIPTP